MSYSAPPFIVDASLANIAGTATSNILPAPGVNFAYRLVGMQLSISRNSTGIVDALLRSATTLTVYARLNGLSIGGHPGGPIWVPEPGLAVDINEALQLVSISTLATGNLLADVYYFVDDRG